MPRPRSSFAPSAVTPRRSRRGAGVPARGLRVELHGHAIDGICRNGPDGDGPLACAPEHPPGAPREAVEACDGLAAGAACTVELHGHAIDGICRNGPDGNGPLACAPRQPPPR